MDQNFHLRFQEALNRRRKSIADLAEETSLSEGALRAYLPRKFRRANPRLKNLVLIAKALGVNTEWLATGEGPEKNLENENMFKIPYLEREYFSEKQFKRHKEKAKLLDDFYFPIGIIQNVELEDYSILRWLFMEGDSMYQVIQNDNLILLRLIDQPISGCEGIYAIKCTGDLFVKRLVLLNSNRLLLKSDNSNYPDLEISLDNANHYKVNNLEKETRIIGKVIYLCHNISS